MGFGKLEKRERRFGGSRLLWGLELGNIRESGNMVGNVGYLANYYVARLVYIGYK